MASPKTFGPESWQQKSIKTSSHPPCHHDPPRPPFELLGLSNSSLSSGISRCRGVPTSLILVSLTPKTLMANLPFRPQCCIFKLSRRFEHVSPLGCGIAEGNQRALPSLETGAYNCVNMNR